MKVTISITDDAGNEIAFYEGAADHPGDWKTLPERPIMTEKYQLFGFTYQPMVRPKGRAGGF